jgi:hypothetical protein
MRDFIKKRLNEELTKDDISKEVSKVIDSKELADKVSKLVDDKVKGDKALEDKVVEITKNVLTQLYKTLWTKRGFWQSTLKNSAS